MKRKGVKMKKTYSGDYKLKVAVEAIRGELTIAEIMSRFQVPESLVYKWKNQLFKEGGKIFTTNTKAMVNEDEVYKLHAKIGQLTLERDFLEKALTKPR